MTEEKPVSCDKCGHPLVEHEAGSSRCWHGACHCGWTTGIY